MGANNNNNIVIIFNQVELIRIKVGLHQKYMYVVYWKIIFGLWVQWTIIRTLACTHTVTIQTHHPDTCDIRNNTYFYTFDNIYYFTEKNKSAKFMWRHYICWYKGVTIITVIFFFCLQCARFVVLAVYKTLVVTQTFVFFLLLKSLWLWTISIVRMTNMTISHSLLAIAVTS